MAQAKEITKRNMVTCQQAIKQWGYSAFARHCAKLGIPFEDCYEAVFGKEPRTVLVQVDTGPKTL